MLRRDLVKCCSSNGSTYLQGKEPDKLRNYDHHLVHARQGRSRGVRVFCRIVLKIQEDVCHVLFPWLTLQDYSDIFVSSNIEDRKYHAQ